MTLQRDVSSLHMLCSQLDTASVNMICKALCRQKRAIQLMVQESTPRIICNEPHGLVPCCLGADALVAEQLLEGIFRIFLHVARCTVNMALSICPLLVAHTL